MATKGNPREYIMPNNYEQGGYATYNPSADKLANAELIGNDILALKAKREKVQKELDELKIKRQNFDLLSVNVPEQTDEDKENIQAGQFRAGAEAMMEYDPATAQSWLLRADEIEARKQNRVAGTTPTAIRQQLRMARDRAYESYKNDKLDDNVREISRQEMLLLTAEMAKPNPSDIDVYTKIDKLYADNGLGATGNAGVGGVGAGAGGVTPSSQLSDEIATTIGGIKFKGKTLDDSKLALQRKIDASGLSAGDKATLTKQLEAAVDVKGVAPKGADVRVDAQKSFNNIKAVSPTVVKQAEALRSRVDGINSTLANFTTNPGQSYYMGLKKQLGDAIGGADFAGLTSFGVFSGLVAKAKEFVNASPVSDEQAKREVQGFINSINASVKSHNELAERLITNSKETNTDGIQLFRDNYELKPLTLPTNKSANGGVVVPTGIAVKKGTIRKAGGKQYRAKRDLTAAEASKSSNYEEVK